MLSLQIIQERLGEKLKDSHAFIHYFEGAIHGLISYKLTFESDKSIVIGLGPDGDSLKFSAESPEENNFDEYGNTKFLSVVEYDPAMIKPCLGRRFRRCRLATDSYQVYAVEFQFEILTVTFSNIDDEMAFGDTLESFDIGRPVQLIELSHQG